jgi:hypothetical protein
MTQQATTVGPKARLSKLTLSRETVGHLAGGEPAETHDRRRGHQCSNGCTKKHLCAVTITCVFCSDVP